MARWFKNASQIVQVVNSGKRFLVGNEMKDLAILQDPENRKNGFSIVVGGNGNVEMVGSDEDVVKRYKESDFVQVVDVEGRSIIPGLIDAHTHPVWAGDRVHEFALKLAGASYMEVHEAGGGINFTVEHTRQASEEELYDLLEERLKQMMRAGTTSAECKSGYGLDVATEVKMLRTLERAKRQLPIEISSTFLGAHSIPKGMTAEEATKDVLEVQLPEVLRLKDSGELSVDSIDVFCEKDIFDVNQTKEILRAGKGIGGLRINFHGEELSCLNSVEMAARDLKAEAISHLEEVSDDGIDAMAKNNTVAVILPTTAYILRLRPPPVRKMIDRGVIVALGTDFNPNAHCLSMPCVMHLAAVNMKMSLNETLAACTINAAHSLGWSKTHGSLEPGKCADFLILNSPRWEHLVYQLAGHDHVINAVVKRGVKMS